MSVEADLAEWAAGLRYEDLPPSVVDAMKLLVRTIIGTAVAGATANGCEAVVDQVKEWGGRPEATIWLYGGRAPAHAAALANSTMARALDICDAQFPGQHIGTSAVPVAFAVAELIDGADGRELITALAVGAEIATRLGLVSNLDGFDPTGACSIFAPAVVAGRLLKLDAGQMLNAMALVFNKAGSSFQSNIDASLAVRVIEGFISQDGIVSAQLARRGITGPRRWLTGVWGYYHLFCKGRQDNDLVAGELGTRWHLLNFGYKTLPQCGATISSTDAVLELVRNGGIEVGEIERIDVRIASPQSFNLVGGPFELGDYPQVSGQFNVRYCVANAIVRKGSELHHFSPEAVCDAEVGALAAKVETHLALDLMGGRPELAGKARVEVRLADGMVLTAEADGPSGFPPRPKSAEMHLAHFRSHLAYGGLPLTEGADERLLTMVGGLDELADVRQLISLLVSRTTAGRELEPA